MHCPLYVEGLEERSELYPKWKVSLGKVSSSRVQMALGPRGVRWLPDASCIMVMPRKFPECKKFSKGNFRFPKCGTLFAVPWIESRGSFLNASWPCHGSKSFQVYCPSSFPELRTYSHGFLPNLNGCSCRKWFPLFRVHHFRWALRPNLYLKTRHCSQPRPWALTPTLGHWFPRIVQFPWFTLPPLA